MSGTVTLSPPAVLSFQRPLTQLVKQTLTISNSNSSPIAFKVKTTAPKQYCVRPNSGRVEAGESCQVLVLLQPMKEDPAPGAKCRDKFLVQSVIITPEREASPLVELWSAVEKEDKAGDKASSSIHEQKIRCAYLAASDDSSSPEAGPGGSTISTVSEQDESKFDTVRPTNGARDIRSADSAFSAAPPTAPSPTVTPPKSETPPPTTPTAPFSVGAAVSGATNFDLAKASPPPSFSPPTPSGPPFSSAASTPVPVRNGSATSSSPDAALVAQLAAAQAEIQRLRAALSQAETTAATLRSRGVGAAVSSGGALPGTAQAVVQQKGQEGVPLQVVAGIVFGVFVLTWLFF